MHKPLNKEAPKSIKTQHTSNRLSKAKIRYNLKIPPLHDWRNGFTFEILHECQPNTTKNYTLVPL